MCHFCPQFKRNPCLRLVICRLHLIWLWPAGGLCQAWVWVSSPYLDSSVAVLSLSVSVLFVYLQCVCSEFQESDPCLIHAGLHLQTQNASVRFPLPLPGCSWREQEMFPHSGQFDLRSKRVCDDLQSLHLSATDVSQSGELMVSGRRRYCFKKSCSHKQSLPLSAEEW